MVCPRGWPWGFAGGSHYAVLDQTRELIAAGADRVMKHMGELRLAVEAWLESDG